MAGRTDVLRIETGTVRGTGFLLDATHALTALHVIGKVVDGALVLHGPLRIDGAVAEGGGFRSPRAIATLDDVLEYDAQLDWACIRLDALEGLAAPPVRALAGTDQSAAWDTYGFPDSAPDTGKAAGGTVASVAASLRFGGQARSVVQVFANEAVAGGAVSGYSGAPVFVGGRAVAMLCAAQHDGTGGAQEGTLYAVAVAALRDRLVRAQPSDAPSDVELAFAECALPGIAATACLVTDEPDALAAEVRSWRDRLAGDPLRLESAKQRIRQASVRALFADPALRPDLLGLVATTSFALYVYWAPAPDDRLAQRALVGRLRTQATQVTRVHARRDLTRELGRALAQILEQDGRPVAAPSSVRSGPLLDIAEVLLEIVARRLVEPASEQAQVELEYVRSRLRFVQNVVTGEMHRREHDPLP